MPKGDNKVTINFTTEMKQFGDSKKGDLYLSFHTALAYLQFYKDEFIVKYGKECYNAHIQRYSIPAIEVRNNSAKRKHETLEQRRRELELREKELAVKTQFLEAETVRMNDKHEENTEKKENKILESPEYKKLLHEKEIYEYCIQKSIEREKAYPEHAQAEQGLQAENKAKLAEIEQKIKEFLENPQ